MRKDEHSDNRKVEEPLVQEREARAAEKKKKPLKGKRPASKSRFKKLEEENRKLEKELSQLNDRYLRLAAEFDNFKKLKSKETDNRIRNVMETLILDILPVLDDLERTLDHVPEREKENPIVHGVAMIRDNMKQILKSYGLEEIESVGKEFDVELHEALMMTNDDNYPPDYVVQEHQKGYKLNNRVIRHAKVAVNKKTER